MIFSKKYLIGVLFTTLVLSISCGKRDDRLTDPDSEATFYVDKDVKIWGKVIVTRDAQQKPNQKDFKIQACLKDNALLAVIQFQDFKVKAGDQEMIKTSDKFGCIIWDEQIRFDSLANEAELLVVRRVEAIRGHAGGVDLELAVNPWTTEDSLSVADLRYDEALKAKSTANAVSYGIVQFQSEDGKPSPAFSMEVNQKQVADAASKQKNKSVSVVDTRMRLDAIQMNFIGHDYSAYEITPTLNLKVAHIYRIRINPQFIRENFNGKQIFETIASGKVKFHVAILKDTVDPKSSTKYSPSDVLSTSEFVGEMVDGVMVADVTLKFQDLGALTGRTILILSSSSLPGFIQFRDGSYVSPLGPLVSVGSISLVPTAMSAESIHGDHLNFIKDNTAKSKGISNFDFFKKTTGFVEVPKQITKVGSPRISYSTNHLQELMAKVDQDDKNLSVSTQMALCSYLTQEKAGARFCNVNNLDLINFRTREIVEDVSDQVPVRDGITFNEDLTINMNYLLSQEQIKGKGQSFRGGWTAGVNAGITGGLNAGLDWDLLGLFQGKKIPGSGLFGWISKFSENDHPEEPIRIDREDLNGSPTLPANPKVLPPKKGVGAKLGGNIGGNFGGLATYNNDLYTWNLSDSRRETGSITTSVKFAANAEIKKFSFKGVFRKCWIMNLSTGFKEKMAAATGKEFSQLGLPKGLYACSPKLATGQRSEVFVLVNSITGIANSPLTDSLNSSEAPLRLFFRGAVGYSVFKSLIIDRKMEVNFAKFPADKLISEVKNLKNEGDMYLNQEFPGVLNPVF